MKQLQAILILSFISLAGVSQDLIVKRDSSRIFCKILKEDSLTIHYRSNKDKQSDELVIKKSDVLNYLVKPIRDNTKGRNGLDSLYSDNIFTAKELKKGVYRSHFEFINNMPSIKDSFYCVKRNPRLWGQGETTYDLLFKDSVYYANRGTMYDSYGNIYGFCDGQKVYVTAYRGVGYCPLEYLGKYSFYTEHFYNPLAGIGGLTTTGFHSPTHYSRFIIVDEKGKQIEEAGPWYFKKLFKEKCPELYEKYKRGGYHYGNRGDYLIMLNECLNKKSN